MLGVAWATLPDLPTYRTGVIMVGLARCIAVSQPALPFTLSLSTLTNLSSSFFSTPFSFIRLYFAHSQMVMIWNQLAGGDADYCAILVILNSILQIILYSPMAVLFVNVIGDTEDLELEYGQTAIAVCIVSRFAPTHPPPLLRSCASL